MAARLVQGHSPRTLVVAGGEEAAEGGKEPLHGHECDSTLRLKPSGREGGLDSPKGRPSVPVPVV